MNRGLFITVRVLRAAAQGVRCLEFPGITSCWAKCPGMLPSSCGVLVPLSLSKTTHLFFVPGALAARTCSQVLLSISLVSCTPRTMCLYSGADG